MVRVMMKAKDFGLPRLLRAAGLAALACLLVALPAASVSAQKLPPILETGSKDPSAFNVEDVRRLKADYDARVQSTSEADRAAAKLLRNRLIGIGREQVDAMFYSELRRDRRRNRFVQVLLDVLEIGAATAISITNGERAKTVISEGLGALQAGRTSLNKNFQLLERQVLINKMEADRANILTGILAQRDRDVTEYAWEDARADLRTYRNAGTLDGALASLNSSVGKERIDAEARLREIKDQPLTGAATPTDLALAGDAFDVESRLEDALGDATKKAAALATLQKIVATMAEDDEVAKLLADKGISATTDDGQKIIDTLDEIKENATTFNRRDLVRKINTVIIDVGSQR
jgi:hypothetical protein